MYENEAEEPKQYVFTCIILFLCPVNRDLYIDYRCPHKTNFTHSLTPQNEFWSLICP